MHYLKVDGSILFSEFGEWESIEHQWECNYDWGTRNIKQCNALN